MRRTEVDVRIGADTVDRPGFRDNSMASLNITGRTFA
jgi:hypothetical protein